MDLYKELLAFLDELKKYREKVLIKTDSKLLSEYQLEYEELRKLMNKSWAVYLEKYPLLKEYSSKIRREELREELREKLLHKSGQLQQHITKLVGTNEITIYEFGQPRSVNVWAMGLRQELDYRTNEALNACIDNTTVAIGKLEAEGKSWGVIDNKQRSTKTELSVDNSEKSAYQKSWQWIESNKILSIIGAIAAIATIVGVVLALIR